MSLNQAEYLLFLRNIAYTRQLRESKGRRVEDSVNGSIISHSATLLLVLLLFGWMAAWEHHVQLAYIFNINVPRWEDIICTQYHCPPPELELFNRTVPWITEIKYFGVTLAKLLPSVVKKLRRMPGQVYILHFHG
jgi:hypothetical protein